MTFDSQILQTHSKQLCTSKRKSILLLAEILASIIFIFGFTGCSQLRNNWSYNHGWNNFVAGHRNRAWSHKAWLSRKSCYPNHSREFEQGFRDGYYAVADGDSGCTPPFPPRKFWGWKYQSAKGQRGVADWFSGYPLGAQAAEQDGVGYYTQIQTSSGIQREYAQAGLMPGEQVGMYPIAQPNPYANLAPTNVAPTAVAAQPQYTDEVLYESYSDGPAIETFSDGPIKTFSDRTIEKFSDGPTTP